MIYGKLPIVFLSTIASLKKDSTNSQIATYLLDHLESLKEMGIKQMANECHVAVSSISRFCTEIGLSDFAELKELLLSTDLYFEEYSYSSSKKQRLKDYSDKVKESIDMVVDSMDMSLIEKLCKEIKNHSNVAIFGLLKAGSVALNLQGDLLMLGKQVYTHISYHEQIQYILNANKDDLIIILSYTGSYFEYTNLRTLQKRLDLPTIWMISSKTSSPLSFINHYLTFDSMQDQNSHPFQLQFIAGLIGQEYCKLK